MKKHIKKTSILLLSLLLASMFVLVLCLSSCGEEVQTLYVYNWGEYISDGSEGSLDVNAAFEEYYYETFGERIKVSYSTYNSNEDMYAKLSSGAVSYDVVIPSDYMIERMIKEGMLAKLNLENIPNAQYIPDTFRGDNAYYDPSGEYSLPYTYGMVGIIYNTQYVPEDEEDLGSWSLMWDPEYEGSILQFNNSRDAFGTAQYFLGLDVNSHDKAEWEKAYNKLLEQKQIVQGYVMDEIFNKMGSESAAIAPYYAGDYLTMYCDNENLSFYYPKEGTNIFVDAMCVPKSSENQLMAERYINFMLSEETAVANAEYICYASPHSLVVQNEDYIAAMQEVHPDAMDILYGSAQSVPTQYYKNLDQEQLETINSLWDSLKIESTIGVTVYVVSGVIIAALVTFGTVHAIKMHRRRKEWDLLD